MALSMTSTKLVAGIPLTLRTSSRRVGRLHAPLTTTAAAPVREREATTTTISDDNDPSYYGPSSSTTTNKAATSTPSTSGRVVLESADELKSTNEHRFWVGLTTALLTATLANGVHHIDGPLDATVATLSAALAYVLSDLGTGIYHWGVDNYGDGNTPVFGSQIAAFQGHHKRPWTITEREFANNVHQVFKPASVPAAILFISSFFAPSSWSVWSSTFLFLACMSQQFHAWSHMKRSELNPLIVAAQESGLLISRKAHGAHHKAPFEGNYCIVSGMWDPILDGDGTEEQSFFRKLEKVIYNATGVEPRCWSEVQEDWKEEVRA